MAFLDHPRYRFDDTKLNKLILKMYFNTWIEEFRFNISQLQPYFNQFGSALRENWPSERDLGDFKWVWILFSAKRNENEFEEVHCMATCLKWFSQMFKWNILSKMNPSLNPIVDHLIKYVMA